MRHFFNEPLDIGAQELRGSMTLVADEVEVPGMAVGRFESGPAFAEVHLPRHASRDHPLQRAVDGRTANDGILTTDEIVEIVSAQMALLAREDVQDAIALARTLPAGKAKAGMVQRASVDRERLTAAAG